MPLPREMTEAALRGGLPAIDMAIVYATSIAGLPVVHALVCENGGFHLSMHVGVRGERQPGSHSSEPLSRADAETVLSRWIQMRSYETAAASAVPSPARAASPAFCYTRGSEDPHRTPMGPQ